MHILKTISHVVVAVIAMIAGFLLGVYQSEPWWYAEVLHSMQVRFAESVDLAETKAEHHKTRAEVAESWARRLSAELEKLKAESPN